MKFCDVLRHLNLSLEELNKATVENLQIIHTEYETKVNVRVRFAPRDVSVQVVIERATTKRE